MTVQVRLSTAFRVVMSMSSGVEFGNGLTVVRIISRGYAPSLAVMPDYHEGNREYGDGECYADDYQELLRCRQ